MPPSEYVPSGPVVVAPVPSHTSVLLYTHTCAPPSGSSSGPVTVPVIRPPGRSLPSMPETVPPGVTSTCGAVARDALWCHHSVTEPAPGGPWNLSLIHISEPTRRTPISYAVF